MTAVEMRCDICGSPDYVGVAAVPSFAVSLAWCSHCLIRGAMPMFCVEVTLCDDEEGPDGQVGRFLTLEETVDKWGVEKVMSIAAPWFLDMYTYVGGELGCGHYILIRDLILKIGENSHTNG